jgi:hypothetical protein
MAFQSRTKLHPGSRWFLGSVEFLTDQFGNLSLQELESSEVDESGTDRLPLALVQVCLVNEAQLRLGPSGEMDTDPIEDKVDHTPTARAATVDPIYSPSSGSYSEYGREVYMVAQDGDLPEKTTKELQREAEEKIARVERLARELDKRKGHNFM